MASFHTTSRRTAVAGVLAAGSLAVLWLACMVPSGRIGLTGAAGLFPVAAVLAAGRAAGYLCWAASALLGLFLLPDKGVALLYLIFLGLYPVVKNNIEGLRRLPAGVAVQAGLLQRGPVSLLVRAAGAVPARSPCVAGGEDLAALSGRESDLRPL